MITLRPYQAEAVSAIRAEWAAGRLSTLAVLATGAGKTEIAFAALAGEKADGLYQRSIFLVDTLELAQQPVERIRRNWREFTPGIVQGENDDVGAEFIVATWQSLVRGDRLQRIFDRGVITHVVVDEAHIAAAESLVALVASICELNPQVRVLGMTATPIRSDGAGLARVFGSVAYKFNIARAIREGALVPFNALAVGLPVDLSDVRETEDGWDGDALGKVLAAENVKEIVLDNWRKYAANRLTLGFTASVYQAREFARYFCEAGVAAGFVYGDMPLDERRAQIERFKSGETRVLFNVFVLTKGFDCPAASCALMIAPTKSDLTYVQRMGRVLRLAKDKHEALIIDFAPTDGRNVIMAGDVLGKPRAVKKAEQRAERQGILVAWNVTNRGATEVDPDELIVQVLNLLSGHALAWTVSERYATAGAGEKSALVIELPDLARLAKAEEVRRAGKWSTAYDAEYERIRRYHLWLVDKGQARLTGSHDTMEAAKAAADEIAIERIDILSDRKKSWRRQSATEAQLKFLKRLGIAHGADIRKGQAAQMITEALAVAAVKRSQK